MATIAPIAAVAVVVVLMVVLVAMVALALELALVLVRTAVGLMATGQQVTPLGLAIVCTLITYVCNGHRHTTDPPCPNRLHQPSRINPFYHIKYHIILCDISPPSHINPLTSTHSIISNITSFYVISAHPLISTLSHQPSHIIPSH